MLKYNGDKKLVIVIIPFGVVGSGKSTFLRTLREIVDRLGWKLESVSSDETRKECMDKILQAQKCTKQKAFESSAKQAGKLFFSRLEKLIADTNKRENPVHIIFIDKNHPLNAIERTVDSI